ncbi:hypothetical protein Dsin_004315 [Dipteronia sinensis]|uniref:Uncharacterized protein n=1 Tax=Dipteronia sinensis TaxID=43782 RepID=A0AAE0ELI0_9ROSI|nr:hypothetical protein Dsin_004315 [Dipteronia sinensis]
MGIFEDYNGNRSRSLWERVIFGFLCNRYYNKDGILEDVDGPTLLVLSCKMGAICPLFTGHKGLSKLLHHVDGFVVACGIILTLDS